MTLAEWIALGGVVATIMGGLLATYMGIRVELAKITVMVANFKSDITRMDKAIDVIRDVVDRRAHGTRH